MAWNENWLFSHCHWFPFYEGTVIALLMHVPQQITAVPLWSTSYSQSHCPVITANCAAVSTLSAKYIACWSGYLVSLGLWLLITFNHTHNCVAWDLQCFRLIFGAGCLLPFTIFRILFLMRNARAAKLQTVSLLCAVHGFTLPNKVAFCFTVETSVSLND